MEEMTLSKDKLDYQSLIFRQIDRLAFVSATLSGSDPKHAMWMRELGCANFESGLPILESLIVWKLSDDNRAKYFEEKKALPSGYSCRSNSNEANSSFNEKKFDLLMKYLPKTGLIVGQRKVYSTGGADDESNV